MAADKKHRFPRPLIATVAIILICIAAVLVLAAYSGGSSNPGFQEYEPAGLPAGLTIKDADLNIERYPGLWPHFNRFIDLNFNLPNSWITESKSDGQAFYDQWCMNYGQHDCHQYRTPGGQAYLLTKTSTGTSEVYQEVYFIRQGTSIDVNIRGYRDMPSGEWSRIVDSFRSAHYDHPKIIRGSTRGP